MALRERVQPLLAPGEQVQEVWWAQSGPNPTFILLTWLVMLSRRYWIWAATTHGVVIFNEKGSGRRRGPCPSPSGSRGGHTSGR
jgi:hypothetical protein